MTLLCLIIIAKRISYVIIKPFFLQSMENYYATSLIKSTQVIIKKTLHTTCPLYTYMNERLLKNFTLVKKYSILLAL